MATITFPSNPVLYQIYSYGGNTWMWDGSSWQLLTNAALNAVVIGNLVPETGTFTVLSADSLSVDSITANTISSNSATIVGNVNAGNLRGGTLSLSGNVLGALRVQGPVSGTSLSTVGAITTNNGITSYGNISAPYFIGDGSQLTNLPSGTNYSNANVAAYLPTYTGEFQAGNVSILGNIAGNNISVLGRIISSGNITGSNISTAGRISATGNIVGNYFFGNGAFLTGINANYSNANVAAYLPTNSANVAGSYFIGNGSLLTSITGANVTGTVASATVAGSANTAAVANSVAGANVTGTVARATNAGFANVAYSVDGANVTGTVPSATVAGTASVANSVAGANVTGTVANATYATTAGSATTAGTATAANTAAVANSVAGANVTGAVASANSANFANYAYSALGAGVIGAVPLANTANVAVVANSVAGANVTGTVANATYAATAGLATTAGTVTGNAQSNITSVGSLTSLTVVGNTSGSDLTLSGKASVAGNVTAGRFIGDGSLITNLPTLNYSNANVAAYLPTYTGNLAGSALSINGGIVANTAAISGRITSTASITATGNVLGGNLNTGGQISAVGNIVGNYFFGNGAFLTGINANYGNANVAAYLPTYSGNINGNNGSFTGSVSVVGNIVAGNISAVSALSVVGNVVAANATVTRTLVANTILSNSITTNGNIYGTYFLGDARYMSGLPNYTNSNVAAFLPTYTGDLTGNSVSVVGNITGGNMFVYGGVVAASIISAVGNISGGNVTTPGWISALGNVHAPYYFGDGSHLTNLNINYSNANVAAYLPTYTGNLNPNRISATGNITAPYFFGNGSQLTGIQATVVGTLASLSVTGNTVTGNLNTAGNVTAAYFIGDGSQLTNLPVGSNYSNANVAAYLPTYTGNLTANTISTTGNITGRFILGNGSQLTGMYGNANVATYLTSYAGNITFNNASAAGNISADFFVGNGSLLTGIQATEIGTLASLSVTGNIDTGNINIDGRVSAAGNIITSDTVNASNVIASGVVQATGNITGGNISSIGQVIANGNVTVRSGSFFIGNGSQLTGVIASGVAANALVGNTLSSNVLYSSLQTVGTLSSLSVSGNTTLAAVNAGIISSSGNITTTGNVKASTLSASGNVTGQYILGNGSQLTGIVATEIGTLTSLSVSGNVNIGGYYIGDGGLLSNIQVTTTYGNANVAAYLPTYTGNLAGSSASVTGTVTANLFVGSGAGLRTLNAANLVGSVPLAAQVSGSAQANITSLGTLTSLSSTGNITSSANIAAGYFVGNGRFLTGVAGTLAGNMVGNITANGYVIEGLTEMSVSGNVTGQYFVGNGAFLTGLPASYSNANVAAYLPTYTGNLAGGNVSVVGNVTGQYFVGNGAFLTGLPASYSNANVAAYLPTYTGNLTANIVSTTGNITAPYFIGNGSQLTGLPASYSNANVAAYLPTYTGNLAGGNLSVTGNINGNYLFGNASQLTSVPSVLTVSNWYTGNVIANSIANVTALRFNANTGITVTDLGNAEALVSLGSSFKTWEVDGQANLVAVGEDVVKFVAGPGIVITTDPNVYPQQIAFAANVSNISNGTSNISIVNNGNIRGVVGGADVFNVSSAEFSVAGNVAGNNVFATGLASITGNLIAGNVNTGQIRPTSGALTIGTGSGNLNLQPAGNIVLANTYINNLAMPQQDYDAATKLYVDNAITTGFSYHQPVLAATTTTLATTTGGTITYTQPNGVGNGIGAYLSTTGSFNLIDTANVQTSGTRILVKNEANAVFNGVYTWSNATTIVRSIDADQYGSDSTEALSLNDYFFVQSGNVNQGSAYVVSAPAGTITFGTSNIEFSQFSSSQTYTANTSAGLSLIGTVFNAKVDQNTTDFDGAGNIIVKASANLTTPNIGAATGTSLSVTGNVTGAYIIGDGSQLTNLPGSTALGNAINMGSNTQGSLVSNAVTLTANTTVTNGIALLNQVLGKLVPPAPTNFPGGTTLTISTLSTYRMANFTQTDNTPGANKSVSGGTTVTSVRRAASYSTNTVANVGPGDSGTVIAVLNGADAGNVTLTSALTGNGTYSNLVITNNYDYRVANANIAAGFWSVFTSQASGSVPQGWNEVRIADTATANTNTPSWYYDASAPGTPGVGNLTISASTTSLTYSSTVGHYNSSTQFTLGFTANRLSGDMYPTSDTFVTGTAGGSFQAPVSVTYATANVTTPLARNLYVSSGAANVTTTSNIVTGFGASTTGPSVSVLNSYATGTGTFTSTLAANVLYKTGTASTMEESNVVVGGTIGSGSGAAFRIVNPGSTDTPAYTGSEAAFNSTTGPLQTYDATIVAAVLKHDQTNYSTGYLPVGPDLSSGRSAAQYFTFTIRRSSVSKFDVKWTGTIAGLWVALPGSLTDSTSTLNGWLDMSTAYGGAGAPGANTGAGGNGSNGCALGGVAPLNSAQTNKSVTATFGTVSSTSATNNEIYIRIKLTSGQSVTALSLQPASN